MKGLGNFEIGKSPQIPTFLTNLERHLIRNDFRAMRRFPNFPIPQFQNQPHSNTMKNFVTFSITLVVVYSFFTVREPTSTPTIQTIDSIPSWLKGDFIDD